MNKATRLILACLLGCFSFVITCAQSLTALQPGTPVERELTAKQVHTYTIDLEENSVLQLVVEQKGIDVQISISSSDGKTLGDFDTPNGANGPENVSFVALIAGTYSIAIEPLNPVSATKGRYQIKILEVRKATDEEVKDKKNLEIAKTKGIDLVRELEGTITQIKTPESRIKARVRAANLLWDDDEKRAAKYLADATADLKGLIASVDANDLEYQQQYSAIWQIRFDMVQLLGEIDPEAALTLLYSTVPPTSAWPNHEQIAQERSLELSVVNQMIEKNPRRAFELARQTLKQAYCSELIGVLQALQAKDPKLATQLANEIVDKLLNEKLGQNTQAAQLTMSLLGLSPAGGTIVNLDGDSSLPNKIPEDKYKALLQKTLDEALSLSLKTVNSPSLWTLLHSLKGMGTALDKTIGGSSAAIDRKYEEITGRKTIISAPQPSTGSVEEVLETIDGSPVEDRERLYVSLAQRELGKGETQRARQIINHVKNPALRYQWHYQIEQQEITQAISSGKSEEAVRLIGALRHPTDRAVYVAELARNFGPGQKRATALDVLEQARALLPTSPQAQDAEQMHALIEISRAFGRYDSRRAFEIIDPLIDQFNEICIAARTLNGFGGDYYRNDELDLERSPLAETAFQISTVLGNLALANFDRAKSTSDRIGLTDVRLKAYLEIASQVLQGNN